MSKALHKIAAALFFGVMFSLAQAGSVAAPYDLDEFLRKNDKALLHDNLVIKSVSVKGNKYISTDLIKSKIPFQIGAILDPGKSSHAINNLYSLGAFKQIEILAREEGTGVHLTFLIEEKKLVAGCEFVGTREIAEKKISETLNLEKISYADDESAHSLAAVVKQYYVSEGYHRAQVSAALRPHQDSDDKVIIVFTVDEGQKASILRVEFVGNKKIPARKLRKVIQTQERWLFGFTDNAGTYDEQLVEYDKMILEAFYFEHGFFNTKVYKTDLDFSEDLENITVTFYVDEGDQYTVKSVSPPFDEIVSYDEAEDALSIKQDRPFRRRDILESMERLGNLWKSKGYIYAEVHESLRPNDETKEVDISFVVNPGKQLYANRISITGNTTSRDSLLRRRLDIVEGDLITKEKLEISKRAVEFLSFYEPNGVNWVIHRLSDDLADLELNVKEKKTGNFNAQLSYGPSGQNEQKEELQGSLLLEKGNLLGHGIDAGLAIKAGFDKNNPGFRRFELRTLDPHIFDKDISCGFYLYRRWEEYDRWKALAITPSVSIMGSNLRFGFGLPDLDKRLALVVDFGVETIHNNNPRVPLGLTPHEQQFNALYQVVVDRTFQQGSMLWAGLNLIKDARNHQMYPSKGYKVSLGTKIAPDLINQTFSFFRVEASGSMYNSILNDDDLVLGNHLKLCTVQELASGKDIPYEELFHMGGPTTIRGHVWSGIGPAWKRTNEPLGGRNAIQSNNEITFPIARQVGMRGHFFYDAGAAWDTPHKSFEAYNALLPATQQVAFDDVIIRNKFNLRHTVGVGINLSSPVPAKIDWGFKLDRQPGESAHEFHLTMQYAW